MRFTYLTDVAELLSIYWGNNVSLERREKICYMCACVCGWTTKVTSMVFFYLALLNTMISTRVYYTIPQHVCVWDRPLISNIFQLKLGRELIVSNDAFGTYDFNFYLLPRYLMLVESEIYLYLSSSFFLTIRKKWTLLRGHTFACNYEPLIFIINVHTGALLMQMTPFWWRSLSRRFHLIN